MNLIIETTRRCNLACEHCLRGKAINVDMQPHILDDFLFHKRQDYISNITFSGGEPSLVPHVLLDTLATLRKYNITLGSFYIATNGVDIPEEFILACIKLYAYCDDKEMCSVQVSNDYFHAEEGKYNTELLDGLAFFSRKHAEEATHDFTCLNEGNYEEFYNDTARVPSSTVIQTYDDLEDVEYYLNCYGQVINGCDWSYAHQPDHMLCTATDFNNYLALLPKEN